MISLDEVRRRVSELAKAGELDSDAHLEEDAIREDVLRAIASGAPNPKELAAAALETEKFKFPRWYS